MQSDSWLSLSLLAKSVQGPVFPKGLSKGLGLNLRLLSQVYVLNFGKSLVVFTNNLRLAIDLQMVLF